jgi:hypothetical protein
MANLEEIHLGRDTENKAILPLITRMKAVKTLPRISRNSSLICVHQRKSAAKSLFFSVPPW